MLVNNKVNEMTQVSEIDSFWQAYISFLPREHRHRTNTYDTWSFGDTQQDAEVCAQLVKAGIKTATSGLIWEMEKDGEKLPEPGDIAIVTGRDGVPICIIEVTECIVKPFNQVDGQFAFDYGEGERTLKGWRKDSWDYFSAVCKAIGREPSETMPLACQRFRLLYP
jgi:uncharacterized protein YhfF